MARAQQELKAAKVSDPHSEQGHRILQHIYFPGWKHRPHLTQVRQCASSGLTAALTTQRMVQQHQAMTAGTKVAALSAARECNA